MDTVEIATVGVVGLGTMGAGIVEVFARAGLAVVAVEVDDVLLVAGEGRLATSLGRAVDRGRLDAHERDAILGRVTFTTERSGLAAAQLVIEAIPERLNVKTSLFVELDGICPAETVFATNTSSLPVTRIAAATGRSGRVIGMHFFNPAPVMRLVEVVHTVLTEPEVTAAVRRLAERCGKQPVVVGDRAGFVANALLFGYLNAAARAVETEQAAATDIDNAMVTACGLPMGPLALLDLIGLDVSLDVLETMFTETRDQRYAAAPLLRRKVMAGQLGRKSGHGYHDYTGEPTPSEAPFVPGPAGIVALTSGQLSAVVEALRTRVVSSPADVTGADLVVVDGGSATATAELLARAAHHAEPGSVFAAVTADDVPLASLAVASGRHSDIVGLHVPATHRGGVVEVVRSGQSTDRSVALVAAAVRGAGLFALVCRDRPGYVVDHLLLPHLGDAVRMVDDSYATREDVDVAMSLGCGYPDGPFAMLAAVGADEVRSRLLHLAAATHLPALTPPPLLDELAAYGS